MADNSAFVKSVGNATTQLIATTAANMQLACLLVASDAKRGCPVDMGVLRASITSDVEISEGQVIGRIGSNLAYAPYVHQGTGIYAMDGIGRKTPWAYVVRSGKHKGFHWTVGQRPQPFLKNAVIKNKDSVPKILGGG